MKRKNIYMAGCMMLMALVGTSCQDWLDMPSESKYDNESTFSSVEKTELAVVGCYPSSFNREMYYQLGMGTDECISTESETNSKNQVGNYVYTTSNAPAGVYNGMYSSIEYANNCIKNLEKMKGSSDSEQKKINQLLGESLAVRAMDYWNLIRFFGDVPFATVPVADLGTFTSSRVSRDVIYDQIIADLQRATDLLAWKSEGQVSTTERFTKNAAYGILARVALYAAGYSLRWDLNTYDPSTVQLAQRSDANRVKELYKIAADACQAVIAKKENALNSSYAGVFHDLLTKTDDSELMLQYGQYGTNVNGASVGYTIGSFCDKNSIYGKTGPAMIANPTYYFDFADGDTRRDVAICNYGVTTFNKVKNVRKANTFSNMTAGKYRADWGENSGLKVNQRNMNFPLLRYSDVLLMYAEALNEYNGAPTDAAKDALKEVRLRAFGGDESKIGEIPSTYQGFRDAIIKERKLELGFEGLRRTDLVRWGILYETLTENKENLLKLARHEAPYANVPKYWAYKTSIATEWPTQFLAIEHQDYLDLTDEQKASLAAEGYTISAMFDGASDLNNNDKKIADTETWMTTSLFRGLVKNQVELLPLNQTSIIDVNAGLKGQQHPKY